MLSYLTSMPRQSTADDNTSFRVLHHSIQPPLACGWLDGIRTFRPNFSSRHYPDGVHFRVSVSLKLRRLTPWSLCRLLRVFVLLQEACRQMRIFKSFTRLKDDCAKFWASMRISVTSALGYRYCARAIATVQFIDFNQCANYQQVFKDWECSDHGPRTQSSALVSQNIVENRLIDPMRGSVPRYRPIYRICCILCLFF